MSSRASTSAATKTKARASAPVGTKRTTRASALAAEVAVEAAVAAPVEPESLYMRFADRDYYDILERLPFLQRFYEIITNKRNKPHRETLLKELISDKKYVPNKFIMTNRISLLNKNSETHTYKKWAGFVRKWNDLHEAENTDYITFFSIENDEFYLKKEQGNGTDVIVIGSKKHTHTIEMTITSWVEYIDINIDGYREDTLKKIKFNIDMNHIDTFHAELFMDLFVGFYWCIVYLNLETISTELKAITIEGTDKMFTEKDVIWWIKSANGLINGIHELSGKHFLKNTRHAA